MFLTGDSNYETESGSAFVFCLSFLCRVPAINSSPGCLMCLPQERNQVVQHMQARLDGPISDDSVWSAAASPQCRVAFERWALCFTCIKVFIDSCCLVGLVKDLCCHGHVISKEPISFWQTLAEKCRLQDRRRCSRRLQERTRRCVHVFHRAFAETEGLP